MSFGAPLLDSDAQAQLVFVLFFLFVRLCHFIHVSFNLPVSSGPAESVDMKETKKENELFISIFYSKKTKLMQYYLSCGKVFETVTHIVRNKRIMNALYTALL